MTDKEYEELKEKLRKEEERRAREAQKEFELNNITSQLNDAFRVDAWSHINSMKLYVDKTIDSIDGRSAPNNEKYDFYFTDPKLVKAMLEFYVKYYDFSFGMKSFEDCLESYHKCNNTLKKFIESLCKGITVSIKGKDVKIVKVNHYEFIDDMLVPCGIDEDGVEYELMPEYFNRK